jgi:hypothetical protein
VVVFGFQVGVEVELGKSVGFGFGIRVEKW